jgi:O-antigen/teichoic acid export membrane protein
MSELKEKSIGSAKWTLFFLLAQYFITFFLSIVLSRLISPSEFGLTGMLSIIISVATVITNSGLASALVFDKKSTEDDYATVFYFNFFISLLLYLILYFSAPLISKFYNQPALISLTRWLSLVFVLNSLSIIQNTILVIKLDFKKQSLIKITALIISVIVSIILAFSGWGVYSIVAQALIQAAITSILFWYYSTWRPKGKFTKLSFVKLWGYGSKILYSNLFTSFVQNIDNMIIGKLFQPITLGLFVRAKSTKAIPESIFTQAFQTSIFPILTKVNEDKIEHRKKHLQFFQIGSFFIFPLVLVFFFATPELIKFLYGEKWLNAIPYLQIISFSIIPYFLGILFNQTLLSLGDSKLFMKLNMFRRVLGLINIPIAIFWGLIPYLYSIVFFNIVGLFIDILYSSSKIGTSFKDYLPTLIKSSLYTLLMAALIVIIQYLPFNIMVLKFTGIIISCSIYFILLFLFERQILGYYLEIFKSFTNRR